MGQRQGAALRPLMVCLGTCSAGVLGSPTTPLQPEAWLEGLMLAADTWAERDVLSAGSTQDSQLVRI